ncbi:LmeA family phospholipid-binding protein [Gordonia sp. NPDC003376]
MPGHAVNKAELHGLAADTPAPPPPSPRLRRAVLVVVAVVVLLGAVGLVADTIVASRAEHRLSESLTTSDLPDSTGLPYHPEVTLGGFPFLTHARDGEFPGATITARGVPAPGCTRTGPEVPGCFAELGATLGPFSVGDGFDIGPGSVIRTSSVQAYSLLNSVNLGRFLGILDLTVDTPAGADRVGGGGPQFGNLERTSGVVLAGTVTLPPDVAPAPEGRPTPQNAPSASGYGGPTVRVSVSVDLSVVDGRLHLRATDFYRGPQEHLDVPDLDTSLRQAVLDRFTATLPLLPMPWDLPATGAHSAGSDVMLEAHADARDLRVDRFVTPARVTGAD